MSNENIFVTDEQLTAYIDGELPPDEAARVEAILDADERVAARLAFLSRSSLPFGQAFEPMLAAAPMAELQAMLEDLSAETKPISTPVRASRRGFLGALAACLVAGAVVDRAFIGFQRRLVARDESSEWRAAVAEYIALYTPDTLAGPVPSREAQAAQLAIPEGKLGLSLSPETIALPGVDFKRALLLQYDDKPLAQIAYLDQETGPMALCIVRSDAGAKPPGVEGRKGMNVIYWSSPSHAFMLIGHAPLDRMQAIAEDVRTRLAV
ncbi:Fis family transcriptional regulator [Rhizobium sp. Root1203]|uniref:anti-sigma factor family protein n=1 Tax=Rhizobium sp. Root1203 TaxID=1736427 RepID=UPI000709B5A9|nr:zf-HC2 domain-containing protein [Rhizobium sp. Root1203]KQV32240.1 Fis family transcriptional regulator [Rhizobium sp. Root1203]